jgi:predicted CxxxxCH...CXXCH cytochrome family protein
MSPADAAKLYSQYISPLASKGYKLLGPACTSSPASIDWYKTFLQDCGGCHFDALALHWYGTKAADFIAYVQLFHNTFPQYKLMITEFACQNFSGGAQCSTSEIYEFMGTVCIILTNCFI